jgi:hypothetical protein
METARSIGNKKGLIGILLLFGLLALAYSVIVPYGEPPDEPAHNAYVWYLLTHRQLPHQLPELDLNATNEGHHPPGYYAVVALLTGWAPYADYDPLPNPYLIAGEVDPYVVQQFLHPASEGFPWKGPLLAVHLARLVSIGMGILSVWVTYQVARHLLPGHPYVALLAAGVHAFIPQFVYISSAVNNDNAAILAGSLLIWQMLRLLRRPTKAGFVVLGVLMGLGILSKISLLAMFPAVGWTVWCAAVQPDRRPPIQRAMWRGRLREIGVKSGLVLLPTLLVSGWWIWRNVQLYGDPLAQNIRLLIYAEFERRLPITGEYALYYVWQQFRSFWGLFGWNRIFLPSWLYGVFLALTALGVAGCGKFIYTLGARRRAILPKVFLLLLVLGGFLLSSWGQGFNRDTVAAQGRFLFPALSAIATLLAIGWLVWWPARRARIVALGVGTLFTLSTATLALHLAPLYARSLTETLPAEAEPVQAEFELWELAGWQAPQPVAGQTWPVTFYWHAQHELDTEEQGLAPTLFVHLVDVDGKVLAKWDGVPTQGRFPPPAWSPDVLAVDTVQLPIPHQDDVSAACLAYLHVGFYFKETNQLQRVAVQSATHPTLPGTLLLGPVMVRSPQAPHFDPQRTTEATFGPAESPMIRLLGFDLASDPETLRVVLYWQAEGEMATNYTVFVHLDGAEGPVAQGDASPCDAKCPTFLWQVGDVWRDEHVIPVADLAAADTPCTLSIGWYDVTTGTRLPAFSMQGERLPEDQLPLCAFPAWPNEECHLLSSWDRSDIASAWSQSKHQ